MSSDHSCHSTKNNEHDHGDSCHDHSKTDYLLWTTLSICAVLYGLSFGVSESSPIPYLFELTHAVRALLHTMWWGVLIGILMLAVLSKIPRTFVMSALGNQGGLGGIVRATAAGVFLDLCSHGILMVGAKLYERGASVGQVMAFLIASPWNSFSLTLILIALIGLTWTLIFIGLSVVIAVSVGLVFELCVRTGVLPHNPHKVDIPDDFRFWQQAKQGLSQTQYSFAFFKDLIWTGIKESRMVLRWLLVGVILAACIRAFFPTEAFGNYFGPSLMGLGLTLVAATIIEVCSEGSTPIAAELLTRANAPGNSFAFLMAGVATDYTEIMVIRETTKSWKIALFLPLISLPQVLVVAWLLNQTV